MNPLYGWDPNDPMWGFSPNLTAYQGGDTMNWWDYYDPFFGIDTSYPMADWWDPYGDPFGGWPTNPTYYNPQVYGQLDPMDPSYSQYLQSYYGTGNPNYNTLGTYAPYINAGLGSDLIYPQIQQPIQPGGQVSYQSREQMPWNPGVVNPRYIPGGLTEPPPPPPPITGGGGGGGMGGVNLGGININNYRQEGNPYANLLTSLIPMAIPLTFPDSKLDWGALEQLMGTMQAGAQPYYFNPSLGNNAWLQDWLPSTLAGNFPSESYNLQRDFLNPSLQMGTGMMGQGYNFLTGAFNPTMQGNLQYLNQFGLPGTQQVLGEQQGLSGMAGGLLGGQGQGYGLTDLLSQIYNQGLPNQQAVQNIVSPLLNFGMGQMQGAANLGGQLQTGQGVSTPQQQQILNSLMGQIQTGGLTPEYVSAMERLVYDPSMESLMGRINQLAGGTGWLAGGRNAELMQRGTQDFQDLLLKNAFGNMPAYYQLANQAAAQPLNQGMQIAQLLSGLGGQSLGYGMQGFGAVPQAMYPFASLGGNLSSDLLGQSLGRYGAASGYGLQNLNTINNLAQSPYQLGMNTGMNAANTYQGLTNSMLGQLLQGYNIFGNLNLGQNQLGAQTMNNLMNTRLGMAQTQLGQNQVNANAAGLYMAMATPWMINATQQKIPGTVNVGGTAWPPINRAGGSSIWDRSALGIPGG